MISGLLMVAGAPRSGTTFVQQILNVHPQIAVGYEQDFPKILRALDQIYFKTDKGTAPLRTITPRERFAASDLAKTVFTRESQDAVMEALYRPVFPSKCWSAGVYVGDKWNLLGMEDTSILGRYRARVLWVIRNPLDVLASVSTKNVFEKKPFELHSELAVWYSAFLAATRKPLPDDRRMVPDSMSVHYEEFILRPERSIGLILRWLGLDGAEELTQAAKRLANQDIFHRSGIKGKWLAGLMKHPVVEEYRMWLRQTRAAPESLASLGS